MKKVKCLSKKFIMRQLLILMLVAAALFTPASTCLEKAGIETTVTAYASTYKSWLDDWDNDTDVYSGINSMVTEEDDADKKKGGALDWLGDALQAVVAILIKNTVGTLLLLLTQKMGMSIENVVFGPILGDSGSNVFQFALQDGNVWGVGGSLLYAVLRNFMFAVFAIQFIWILGTYLLKGTGKGKADLKEMMFSYLFLFSLLYAIPIITDIILFFRDALLKLFLKVCNSVMGGGSFSLGVTDMILDKTADDYTIAGALILCFTAGAGFLLAFDYVQRAIQQTYLFGIFPVVAFRSFTDKGILNKWVGHFITSLFIPVLDCVGLMLVCMIQSAGGELVSDEGPAVLGLLVFMSIIPCRNLVAQLFGMPVGNSSFGLAALAAMMMRARRPKGSDKGLGDKNREPGSAGTGETGEKPISGNNTNEGLNEVPGANAGSGSIGEAVIEGASGSQGSMSVAAQEISYDGNGNAAYETTTYDSGGSDHTTYSYDQETGNVSSSQTQGFSSDGTPVGFSDTSYSYDSDNNLQQKTTDLMDAGGNLTGSRVEKYDENGRLRYEMASNYGGDGSLVGGETLEKNYDSNGTITGAELNRYGEEGKPISRTTEQYDEQGNVTNRSEWSEQVVDDGTITQTMDQYDMDTGNKMASSTTEYAPGSEYASSMSTTTYDANGKPSASSRAEYDAGGNITKQIDTSYQNGMPSSEKTTTFDSNGNITGTSLNNNPQVPVDVKARDAARAKLDTFKNAFVPPTKSITDLNGNTRKVQDQEAIKRQIAIAERKLGYAHKDDGTIDWQVTGRNVGNVMKNVGMVTATGMAVSAAAVGGGRSMVAAGAASAALMGGGRSGNRNQTSQTQEQTTSSEQRARVLGSPAGAIPKTAPRKKPLSREAQAAKNVQDRFGK